MDFYQFETSSATQGNEDSPFSSKLWSYVNDTNQGAYGSNNVTFDLSSLYNSQKFIGVNEMELVVPLVMVLSKNDNGANDLGHNDFAMALKNGYYQIIDSMTVEYDGKQVQQQCTHSNFYTSFKINSTMSHNDLLNVGPSLGIWPDTPTSWQYSRVPGERGVGLTNNDNLVAHHGLRISDGEAYNKGMLERQKRTSVGLGKFNDLTPSATLAGNMRNYTQYVAPAGSHNRQYQVYYITATIRLGDISSFFAKMPLTRGFYARLTLNMNMGSCRMDKAALNASLSLIQDNCNFPNQTCPFMVAKLTEGLTTDAAFNEIVCGIYIAKVTASVNCATNHSTLGIDAHKMNACRIYAPMYELEPQKAITYIQSNRSKYVEYEDISYVPLINLDPNSGINFTVTNNAIDPLALLIIPMLSASANSSNVTPNQFLYPYSSPFTCEPACTSPVVLSNFNVALAGVNVFQANMNYDYEMFMHEVLGVNSINGSGSLGLSSGLIDQVGFENIYKYYYVNLERRVQNKNIPVSIAISATQPNSVRIDLHVFVVCRKSIIIDCDSGKLVSSNQ
jgi:hypothetical protein